MFLFSECSLLPIWESVLHTHKHFFSIFMYTWVNVSAVCFSSTLNSTFIGFYSVLLLIILFIQLNWYFVCTHKNVFSISITVELWEYRMRQRNVDLSITWLSNWKIRTILFFKPYQRYTKMGYDFCVMMFSSWPTSILSLVTY